MKSYLLSALAVALAAAVAWAAIQSARLSTVQAKVAGLRSELADAELERDQALAGASELSRLVREQQHRDRAARPVLDAIKQGDFDDVDAPLNPDLQRLLECLRTGSVNCALVPD